MADIEVIRGRHKSYIYPRTTAGKKFVLETWDAHLIMEPECCVGFRNEFIEEVIEFLRNEEIGLDVEVR